MALMTFRVSGREFTYDGDKDWTADELFALDEIGGIDYDEIKAVLTGAIRGEQMSEGRVMRVMCVLAFIGARRHDPSTTWAKFSREIEPASLQIETAEPATRSVPVATAERAAAAVNGAEPADTGLSLVELAEQFAARDRAQGK